MDTEQLGHEPWPSERQTMVKIFSRNSPRLHWSEAPCEGESILYSQTTNCDSHTKTVDRCAGVRRRVRRKRYVASRPACKILFAQHPATQ